MRFLFITTTTLIFLSGKASCFSPTNIGNNIRKKDVASLRSMSLTTTIPVNGETVSTSQITEDNTAASPNAVDSQSSTTPLSNRDQLEISPDKFPRTWVPLASIVELDPDRPTPINFLGKNYVCYRDNHQNWVTMDDACPHRLAPLSEGRIDRETDTIECSYHGWAFNSSGSCERIPQASSRIDTVARKNNRSCAISYPTVVHKNILWTWPWPEDPLSVFAGNVSLALPEGIMDGIHENSSTYTRDLPYGWDMLVENIIDPSHVPFAHHGLQGTRNDAIPINMTVPVNLSERGFSFQWDDRTMGKERSGTCEFRAPFLVRYDGSYPRDSSSFRLSVLCIPTKPGWCRAIVVTPPATDGDTKKKKKKTEKENSFQRSLMRLIFSSVQPWMIHQLSNRFLDSDLAFLHYQDRKRDVLSGHKDYDMYFMPCESDRSVSMLRRWISKYAHIMRPLPPAIESRGILFDRYAQHTSHCIQCQTALKGMKKWRRRTYVALTLSILGISRHWLPRITTLACLGYLRLLTKVEKSMKEGDFKHYENH